MQKENHVAGKLIFITLLPVRRLPIAESWHEADWYSYHMHLSCNMFVIRATSAIKMQSVLSILLLDLGNKVLCIFQYFSRLQVVFEILFHNHIFIYFLEYLKWKRGDLWKIKVFFKSCKFICQQMNINIHFKYISKQRLIIIIIWIDITFTDKI